MADPVVIEGRFEGGACRCGSAPGPFGGWLFGALGLLAMRRRNGAAQRGPSGRFRR